MVTAKKTTTTRKPAAKKVVDKTEAPVEALEVLNYDDLDADTQALLAEAEALEAEIEVADKAAARRSLVVMLSHYNIMKKNGRGMKEVIGKLEATGLVDGSANFDTSTVEGITELAGAIEDIVLTLVGPVKAQKISEDLEGDAVRLVMVFMEMLQLAEVKKA